jgi:hypothetical protein
LSDTYYLFEGKRKGLGNLFSGLCWLVAATAGVVCANTVVGIYLDVFSLNTAPWRVFASGACLSLAFVGCMPHYFTVDKILHHIGAGLSAGFMYAWVIIIGWWDIALIWTLVFGAVAFYDRRNNTFWLEMACFASAFHTLLKLSTFA